MPPLLMGNFLKVLHSNWLFLKLNQFIGNYTKQNIQCHVVFCVTMVTI